MKRLTRKIRPRLGWTDTGSHSTRFAQVIFAFCILILHFWYLIRHVFQDVDAVSWAIVLFTALLVKLKKHFTTPVIHQGFHLIASKLLFVASTRGGRARLSWPGWLVYLLTDGTNLTAYGWESKSRPGFFKSDTVTCCCVSKKISF